MQVLLEEQYKYQDGMNYMALRHFRLDHRSSSRKGLERLIKLAPSCRQSISLMNIVEYKIKKD